MFNNLQFNPAIAGTQNAILTTLAVRNQWVNLPGAPVVQSLTSQFPIYRLSSGAGISITNDIYGQQRTTSILFNYAYHKSFKNSMLSFGLSGGIVQRALDGSKLKAPEGIYENIIDHNDPDLPVTLQTDLIPDFGAGIYFFGKHFYTGASTTHIIHNAFNYNTTQGSTTMTNDLTGYFTVGYKFFVINKCEITPNILYKTDFSQSMIDVNTLFSYNDNIYLGASFRSYLNKQTDAVAAIAGVNITKRLAVSYSYDITTSALSAVSGGSHEIVIRYKIETEKPRAGKKINNFRYLYY